MLAPASLHSFLQAVSNFFDNLASVSWGALAIGLLCFGANATIRSRAYFNVLRAALPTSVFRWRTIWGAYVAGFGINQVIPARAGDVVKVFLTKNAVPQATYPTVAATYTVELIFDNFMAILVLTFAFTQGVFPKPPDFSKLGAFDLSYLASHPRFTLFLLTLLGVLTLVAFALLSMRVRAFWARVKQGYTILRDRRRYLRQVAALQFVGWLFRGAAIWALLEAFHIGGSVRNVLLVLGVFAVSSVVPLTPSGAGVQQALLVKIFAGAAAPAAVAAYSVGQEIALAAFSFALGLAALFFIFRVRSFREVIRAGRDERAAAEAGAG
ncbi:MAG TPA: lysylphosphatidylglycerol synthase domain-containing protein [Solirubrobacteraceae bacterium]|nr:lysylphosphatidylglycerol synthase domain-containing protein [Solirubrobacteraceae bacterium]